MDTVQRLFGIGSARTIVQCSIYRAKNSGSKREWRERERRKIVTNKQAATVTRKTFPNNMTNFTRIGIETINLIFRGAYWHRQRWPYVNHEMLCFLFSTFSFFCPFSLVFFCFVVGVSCICALLTLALGAAIYGTSNSNLLLLQHIGLHYITKCVASECLLRLKKPFANFSEWVCACGHKFRREKRYCNYHRPTTTIIGNTAK